MSIKVRLPLKTLLVSLLRGTVFGGTEADRLFRLISRTSSTCVHPLQGALSVAPPIQEQHVVSSRHHRVSQCMRPRALPSLGWSVIGIKKTACLSTEEMRARHLRWQPHRALGLLRGQKRISYWLNIEVRLSTRMGGCGGGTGPVSVNSSVPPSYM